MDIYGNRYESEHSNYKCEHSRYECPYKDCNYHVNSTGKYAHVFDEYDIPSHLPRSEEGARNCMSNLDI